MQCGGGAVYQDQCWIGEVAVKRIVDKNGNRVTFQPLPEDGEIITVRIYSASGYLITMQTFDRAFLRTDLEKVVEWLS